MFRPALPLTLSGLALLLLSACGDAPPPHSDPPALTVAAWNIEHLAATDGAGCAPRDEAGYARAARYIAKVDADIWLLQEIENADALARVFGAEGWVFHVEARPDSADPPECRGREDGATLTPLRTGIAVREGIDHERLDDVRALDVEGEGLLRWGVAITVTEGEPLDLLSVHLKSGCFQGDRSTACPALFDQMPVIEDWLATRGAAGRAAIAGGDFNRRLALAGDPVRDSLLALDAGVRIAGDGVWPECDPRYYEFIDFLVLNEDAARRKRDGSFFETVFNDAEPLRPSDHCAITIDLD